MAKRAVQMAKQEEQIREQMAVQRLALTDAAANEPPIRILALALKPANALERFRRRLPTGTWVEALQAIDGSNLTGACSAVVARSLRYHKLGKPSAGMLGNWLTKYDALQAQIRDRVPFQVMIEDDLVVSPGFAQLVLKLVRSHFGSNDSRRPIREQVNLVVLGRWGEAYLTSLASAKRVVRRLRLNGIRRNPDIQLNDGSVGRTIKLPEYMSRGCWNLSRATNQGDTRRHRGSRLQLQRVIRSAARWACHHSSAETTCPRSRAGRPQLEDGATGRRAKTLAISSGGRGGTPCTARQLATARCQRPSRHTPLDPPPRFARLANCPLGA